MIVFISSSVNDTENIGQWFAEKLMGNEIIAFKGTMGMGKTAFTRGITKYFGASDQVSSPTFSIVNEYTVKNFSIYHFDMYRINSLDDLESTGFFDYIKKGVIIIEWSENIREWVKDPLITVNIEEGKDENHRKITIEGLDPIEDIVT